jgi:hypothetical protein
MADNNQIDVVRGLEKHYYELDAKLENFLFALKLIGGLAVALGLTASGAFLYFRTEYQQFERDEIADQIKVKNLNDSIMELSKSQSELSKQLIAYQNALPAVQAGITTAEKHLNVFTVEASAAQSAASLRDEIVKFQSSGSTKQDVWEAYKTDLAKLCEFAVRYVGALQYSPNGQLNEAINTELHNAAESVRARTQSAFQPTDVAYRWHVTDTPTNFNNLLDQLRTDRMGGQLNKSMIECYRQAFPVWLDNVGVHGAPTLSNSAECRTLLRLAN